MTATYELRRLLDERGVEWWQSANTLGCVFTRWQSPLFGDEVCAMENGEEGLVVFDHYLTPAQAIDATLGRGTCKLDFVAFTKDGVDFAGFRCDGCGFTQAVPGGSLWGVTRDWSYCPNCGAKVVE